MFLFKSAKSVASCVGSRPLSVPLYLVQKYKSNNASMSSDSNYSGSVNSSSYRSDQSSRPKINSDSFKENLSESSTYNSTKNHENRYSYSNEDRFSNKNKKRLAVKQEGGRFSTRNEDGFGSINESRFSDRNLAGYDSKKKYENRYENGSEKDTKEEFGNDFDNDFKSRANNSTRKTWKGDQYDHLDAPKSNLGVKKINRYSKSNSSQRNRKLQPGYGPTFQSDSQVEGNIQKSMQVIQKSKVPLSDQSIDSFRITSGKFFEYLTTPAPALAEKYGKNIFRILDMYCEEITGIRKELIRSMNAAHNITVFRDYLRRRGLNHKGPKKVLVLRILREAWGTETEVSNKKLTLMKYFREHPKAQKRYIPMDKSNYAIIVDSDLFNKEPQKTLRVKLGYNDQNNSMIIRGVDEDINVAEEKVRNFLINHGTIRFSPDQFGPLPSFNNRLVGDLVETIRSVIPGSLNIITKDKFVDIVSPLPQTSLNIKSALQLFLAQPPKQADLLLYGSMPTELSLIPASDPNINNPALSVFFNRRLINSSTIKSNVIPDIQAHKLYNIDSSSPINNGLADAWKRYISTHDKVLQLRNNSNETVDFWVEIGKVFSSVGRGNLEYRKPKAASLRKEENLSEYISSNFITSADGLTNTANSLLKLSDEDSRMLFVEGVSRYNWVNDSNTITKTNKNLVFEFLKKHDKCSDSAEAVEATFTVDVDSMLASGSVIAGAAILDINKHSLLIPNAQNDLRLKSFIKSDISGVIEKNPGLEFFLRTLELDNIKRKKLDVSLREITFEGSTYTLETIAYEESQAKTLGNGFSYELFDTTYIYGRASNFTSVKLLPIGKLDAATYKNLLENGAENELFWSQFISFCVSSAFSNAHSINDKML